MGIDTGSIWEKFNNGLKGYIRKRVRDEDTAEDLLQEILCKIHDNLHKLKDTDKLGAWVYQITRNVIIDYYRLQKSMATHEEVPKDRIYVPVESVNMGEEVAFLCVKPMIDSLPEKYQEAIMLTEYEGLTQKKMAEKLEMSISGAKSRVQRARQKLKKMLFSCCHFEFDCYRHIIDYYPHRQVCCSSCYENQKDGTWVVVMTDDEFVLQVHQDPSDLLNLKKEWKDLLTRSVTHTIFQTWEWNQLWWKHFGPPDRLFLLTLRNSKDKLVGLAPLFCHLEMNNQKRIQFIGGTEISDYLDFIVEVGNEHSFYATVISFLKSHPDLWDAIDLHCIPAGSPTITVFRGFGQERGLRENLSMEEVCPRATLSSSWDQFLAAMKKKDRHEIRRKINRIQRQAENVRYTIANSATLSEDIECFLQLHAKSNDPKMAFMNHNMKHFFLEMARIFMQKEWLELLFLEANGVKLAALLNFKYRDTVYVYNSGYDPKFGRWSPGWVLISHSIQDAIEGGIKIYDFLRGNESYKYRFGAKDFEIFRYKIKR